MSLNTQPEDPHHLRDLDTALLCLGAVASPSAWAVEPKPSSLQGSTSSRFCLRKPHPNLNSHTMGTPSL